MGIFDWARKVLGPKPAPEPEPKPAPEPAPEQGAEPRTGKPKAKAKAKPKNAVPIWRYCRASGGRDIYCPHCHTKHSISSMNWSVKTCRHCASAAGQYGWLTVPKTAAEKMASVDPAKEGIKWDTAAYTAGNNNE
jgi:hypothetical protein